MYCESPATLCFNKNYNLENIIQCTVYCRLVVAHPILILAILYSYAWGSRTRQELHDRERKGLENGMAWLGVVK
jgi:hypothetical protein